MRGCCAGEGDNEEELDPYKGDDPEIADYKRKHRNMRKNWDLPTSFPDHRVIAAYRKACCYVQPNKAESKNKKGMPSCESVAGLM